MLILNFGSLNIDHVYHVEHFVRPEETRAASGYFCNAGGKGLNQSIALARAGAPVFHAGLIGRSGRFLKEVLDEAGVDTRFVKTDDAVATGHAIIQVTPEGENAIILHGGANHSITLDQVRETVDWFSDGDVLLLQNEINAMPEIMARAHARGLRIFFNPAPMSKTVLDLPLELVDTFIVNELEGATLADMNEIGDPLSVLSVLKERYPRANLLLTLGGRGSLFLCQGRSEVLRVPVYAGGKVWDTTAAGDTFIGYFLAGIARGEEVSAALEQASCAAGLCVTRKGAAESIPKFKEVSECVAGAVVRMLFHQAF